MWSLWDAADCHSSELFPRDQGAIWAAADQKAAELLLAALQGYPNDKKVVFNSHWAHSFP